MSTATIWNYSASKPSSPGSAPRNETQRETHHRGAIRKDNWKLVKTALLPGKTELFDLATDIGEKKNVANDHSEIVEDLTARLVAYAKEQKMSEWLKVQPGFFGPQAKTAFDADYDMDDGGLPREKPVLPQR